MATPKRFSVPSSGTGNLWKVFEIDPVSMEIIPVNIIKDQSNPGSIGSISSYSLRTVLAVPSVNEEVSDEVEIQSHESSQMEYLVDEEENAEIEKILDDVFTNSKEKYDEEDIAYSDAG